MLSRRKEVKETKNVGRSMSYQGDEGMMLTEIKRNNNVDKFDEDMIEITLKLNNAHLDGITSIELLSENRAFITSSFDCCCYIWSIETGQRIGALLLGGDPNWKLTFNMASRKADAVKEASDLLERIGKKKLSYYVDSPANEEEQKEMQNLR